jgi:hypothetical protein
VLKDEGRAPMPYWVEKVLERVCTLSIIKSAEIELTLSFPPRGRPVMIGSFLGSSRLVVLARKFRFVRARPA